MSPIRSPFLRRVIGVDAAACAASGLLLTLGGPPLADLTGLPTALSQPVGLFLIAWSLLLAAIAARPAVSRAVVWTLIAVNVAWVAESLLLLATPWVAPTGLGYALVVGQAAAVALIADLQFVGLRRARVAA